MSGSEGRGGQIRKFNTLSHNGAAGPSGQLEKLDRVVIRSLGPKGVITLMSKRGKDMLHVVKAGRSHQAQLVDVEEIVGEELPSAVGDAPIVRAGVSLISSIQLRITHFNLTFEGTVEFVVQILEGGLDLGKHTSIIFKENKKKPNICDSIDGESVMGSGRDSFWSSGHGLREKSGVGQHVDVGTSNSTGVGEQNVSLKNPRQCASAKFGRIFMEYSLEYRLDIVCLLKPRINGGIWLGWKDTIRVEVIQKHP
ncbi:hypothetical protein Gotur_019551 [Gossypium turneri]